MCGDGVSPDTPTSLQHSDERRRSVGEHGHRDALVAAEQHGAGDRGRPELLADLVEHGVERAAACGRTAGSAAPRRRRRGCRGSARAACSPSSIDALRALPSSPRAMARTTASRRSARASVCDRVMRVKSSKRSRSVTRARRPGRRAQPAGDAVDEADAARRRARSADRGERPRARCEPIEPRAAPAATGRGSRLRAERVEVRARRHDRAWRSSAASAQAGHVADGVDAAGVQLVGGLGARRPTAARPAAGGGTPARRRAARPAARRAWPPRWRPWPGTWCGRRRRVIGRPTRSRTVARAAGRRSRPACPTIRRSPPTSRNASSIEMPSTSGVVSSNTSNTALLASV